jgi:hypothetical protein
VLYVYEREEGWQLEIFCQFASYLERLGFPTRIKAVRAFRIKTRSLWGSKTPLHHAVAILQDTRGGCFRVLDLHDWTTPFDVEYEEIVTDPRCKVYLKGQFEDGAFEESPLRKIRPWTYFEADSLGVQSRVESLRRRSRSIDRLYFKGTMTIPERRPVLADLRRRGIMNVDDELLDLPAYLEEASRYRVMLGLPGMAKLSHREIEGFGIGTPVLMPKVKIRLHDPLIPDYHYVSVQVDADTPHLHHMADRIARRYEEVRHDHAFLASVARNATRWYEANVRFPQSLALTKQLLGI